MEDDKSKAAPRERTMEENAPRQYEEDVIDLGQYWAILWPLKWKIAGISLAVGIVTLLLMFLKPNIYKSTAVIGPSEDEKRNTPAIGALASSFGVQLGGPSTVEDLESLFKSDDLAVRVFRKYNLWPILLADRFDPATGKVKPAWTESLFGSQKGPKPPGDWDAIRAANSLLKVSVNKKTGTISISFESPSAEGSANIVKYFLEEGKSRLQEEALDRATQNKKFIQEQIGKTVDALTRDRFYSLYGQEVEREMMARNREQFGFRVIDSPKVPDRKSRPARGRNALGVTLVSGIAFSMYFIRIGRRKHPEEAVPGKR